MISIGGVIGVGTFLGSGSTVRLAGPAVILSYVIGGAIMLLVMTALAEMSVARPAPGSFRFYAHNYLSPYFGFLTGWVYWLAWVAIMSSEIVAASTYMRFWVPASWSLFFGLGFALLMTAVNLTKVESFGEFEFWFSIIKVAAIVVFIAVGAVFIAGLAGRPPLGATNYLGQGGFLPLGLAGVALATVLVIFAYGGTEVIGVAVGESENPRRDVPRAINGIIIRTLVLYIGSITILVGVIPWREVGLTESPFVLVFEMLGIPAASAVMNLVVVTAALSSMNAGLYTSSRILYSLAREGQAPRFLAAVRPRSRVPARAVIASTLSLYGGVLLYHLSPANAFLYVTSISAFGIAFTWLIIVATHLAFRPKFRAEGAAATGSATTGAGPAPTDVAAGAAPSAPGTIPALSYRAPFYPWGSAFAALALVAVMVVMYFLPTERVGLISGGAAVAAVSLAYGALLLRQALARRREKARRESAHPWRPAEPAFGPEMAAFLGLRPGLAEAAETEPTPDGPRRAGGGAPGDGRKTGGG